MADSPEEKKTGFIAGLTDKKVSGACPMCHTRAWEIEDDLQNSKFDVASLDPALQQIYGGYFPTYWMACSNCGFVAHFLKTIIERKRE